MVQILNFTTGTHGFMFSGLRRAGMNIPIMSCVSDFEGRFVFSPLFVSHADLLHSLPFFSPSSPPFFLFLLVLSRCISNPLLHARPYEHVVFGILTCPLLCRGVHGWIEDPKQYVLCGTSLCRQQAHDFGVPHKQVSPPLWPCASDVPQWMTGANHIACATDKCASAAIGT